MSLRHFTTCAIDCDGPGLYGRGCDECVFDACEVQERHLREFARRDGWTEAGGQNFCPSCMAKRRAGAATADPNRAA